MARKRIAKSDGGLSDDQMARYKDDLFQQLDVARQMELMRRTPKAEWKPEEIKRYAALRKRHWRWKVRDDAIRSDGNVPKSYSGTPSSKRAPKQRSPEFYKTRENRRAARAVLDNIGVLERCASDLWSASKRCETAGFASDAAFFLQMYLQLSARARRMRTFAMLPEDKVADLTHQIETGVFGRKAKRKQFEELAAMDVPGLAMLLPMAGDDWDGDQEDPPVD